MNNRLQNIVLFGAIYNFLLGLGLFTPLVLQLLGLNVTDTALGYIIGILLFYTAVVQFAASKSLQQYMPLVFWEGILRWAAAILLVIYGFFGHLGFMAGVLGIIDFIIGCLFILYIPQKLSLKAQDLFLLRNH